MGCSLSRRKRGRCECTQHAGTDPCDESLWRTLLGWKHTAFFQVSQGHIHTTGELVRNKMRRRLRCCLKLGQTSMSRTKWGNTLLHYIAGSSMRGSKEATELVMEFGTPDVSAVNNEGLTALDIAAKKNDETLVKFLLKYS